MRGVAVLAHGSGSSVDFVERAFGAPLAAAGFRLVTVEDRTGDVRHVTDLLVASARAEGAVLLGGVSLGAHAAVRAAARPGVLPGLRGLLLALPAWTGAPGAVAALSAVAAEQVQREGLPAVVRRLAGEGWVGAELAAAWPTYGEQGLVAALRSTARSPGPTVAELRAVTVPVGLVALDPDPFHPVQQARAWVRLLPHAVLEVLPHDAPAADRAVLGRAALVGWRAAGGRAVSGSR